MSSQPFCCLPVSVCSCGRDYSAARASAAAMPDDLYRSGEGAKIFERTASRLEEMQSQEYLALQHLT